MNNVDNHDPLGGTPAWGTRRGPVVPYVPGLDGIRALAVLAVVVYHANRQWLGGGFLGVEVFFVISGYLITLLLIAERERNGGVSLGNFWLRRARRLLPALFTLLIGTITYCAMFDKDRLGMLRGDVIAGAVYVSNWFQIHTGSSYTSEFAFAPLRHLWSLAVEEQFYIVWPLIMFALLWRLRPRTLPILAFVFTGVSLAIGVYSAKVYNPGPIDTLAKTPHQYMMLFGHHVLRTDFLYLGTITRASGLFLGAALATIWRPWAIRRGRAGSNASGLDILGIVGVVSLGFMCWKFRELVVVTDSGTQGYDLLYRGGLILVALATVAVIATVTHPRSLLGKYVIGTPLLVWIGKRSYGLYLYHWTVFQAYRKSAGTPLNVREFIGLMCIALVLTEVSYRFIETPIRTGKFTAWWRERRRVGATFGPLGVAVAILAIVPVFSIVSMAGAKVIPDDITASLNENESAVVTIPSSVPASSTIPGSTTLPSGSTTVPATKLDVLAVGDSVMLGAASGLTKAGFTVDAAKNRQVIDALQIFNYYKAKGTLADNVVIHLGTNGTTRATTYEAILAPLAAVPHVFILTLKVPGREYQKLNNDIIRALPATHPNVTVLEWYSEAKAHPDWFGSDGTHLNTAGREGYVTFIKTALGR